MNLPIKLLICWKRFSVYCLLYVVCSISNLEKPYVERNQNLLTLLICRYTLNNGVLQINNVDTSDAAKYRCKVTSISGQRYSREAQLNVTTGTNSINVTTGTNSINVTTGTNSINVRNHLSKLMWDTNWSISIHVRYQLILSQYIWDTN